MPTRQRSRDTGISHPASPPACSPGELFDDSLALHEHCLGAGLMEASYYALLTAMHCAEATSSRKAIDLVIRLASERQQAIDAERPPHRTSTSVADERGAAPLYQTLAIAAKAIRTRLARERTQAAIGKLTDLSQGSMYSAPR